MVRKRSNADLEPLMPTKGSPKDKSDAQKEAESASMSDKDNSDFSNKDKKVWSRELRNRFVISNKKRSLRFTDEVHPPRHMRSCRMAITNREHYTLSQSDDDDEPLFRGRTSRRLRHDKRRMSSPEPENHTQVNKRVRTLHTPQDEEENPEEDSGIRRSTRKRKLKYDNYSDSWIVGAQTLRGYPQENYLELREMYGGTPHPEYESRRPYCTRRVKNIKQEEEEDEEGEGKIKANAETEGDTEDQDIEVAQNVNADKRRSGRRNNDKERNEGQDNGEVSQPSNVANTSGFSEDMYSRVKRQRTRRSIYDGSTLLDRRRQTQRQCMDGQGNSSEESDSSSDDEAPPLKRNLRVRERVERRKYHLRETKPTVKRFQITHVEEPARRKSSRTIRAVLCETRRRHRRSSSSSSSSSSSEHRFDRKKPKTPKGRNRLLAVAEADARSGKVEGGSRLADVDPISLDTSIRFSHVGGLKEHVRCLQEMVVFPMLYSEVFKKYHVTPPKGVLFHGPPGTGKTLIARALANECSQGDRKVTFFMRKGADVLSKWVGESERQLRLLFDEAYQARPSIIFFDEIDGLAPVRSAKQDQIHSSIVSTLLALMDGLNDRGEIVVIGATNRIDAIDPALRRPGRFDRELLFPLPGVQEREEILKIHTRQWEKPPPPALITHLAKKSVGYGGSDLRALCSEAVIQALQRRYPQIYESSRKLLLNPDNVKVERCDFEEAQGGIVPAYHRVAPGFAKKLPNYLEPLLGTTVSELATFIQGVFPCGFVKSKKSIRMLKPPRFLLLGQREATNLVAAAVLSKMEQCPVITLDIAAIYSDISRTPESAVLQVLYEVRRSIPAILFVPGLSELWRTLGPTVKTIFRSHMFGFNSTLPILLLATAVTDVPSELSPLFSSFCNEVYKIKPFTAKQKEDFYKPLLVERAIMVPPKERKKEPLEELPEAPPPPPPKLTEEQLRKVYAQEEHKLRELRIFLRQICGKLARNKSFFMFSKPVDIEEVPDYLTIIKQPMDLETMMTKIDLHKYNCAQDFLNDVELICANALEYNPDKNPADKLIRHSACSLRDTAYALIKAEMDSDFEETCRGIRRSRIERGSVEDKFAPNYVKTAAMVEQEKLVKLANGTSSQSNSTAPATSVVTGEQSNSAATVPTPRRLNKTNLILARKRRKRSKWYQGILKKVGKKPPLKLTQRRISQDTKNKSSSKTNEEEIAASSMDDTINSEMDSKAHSTPVKGKRKSTEATGENQAEEVMVNGVDGMSTDDEVEGEERLTTGQESGGNDNITSDCSYATDPTCNNSKDGQVKSLVVNKAALTRLVGEAVKVTQHVNSLHLLINLYAQLRQVICRYYKLWNRSKLPQELDAVIKKFAAEHKEDFIEQDDILNTSRDESAIL